MLRQGEIASKPNVNNCFPVISVCTLRDNTLIATISGSHVHIFDGNYRLLQQIDCKEELSCIALQSGTDIICVASKNNLWFYYPKSVEKSISWKLEFEHEYPCNVTSLDWGVNSMLLVGGSILSVNHIQLLDNRYHLITEFQVDLPFVPTKCQYSPCAGFFAILGPCKQLMIWYKRVHGHFDFILLPHVKKVVHFEWRSLDTTRDIRNALLTLSEDNIPRFWAQVDQGYGFFGFDLVGVIDPSKNLYTNTAKADSESFSFVHWLTGRALSTAVYLQRLIRPFKETLTQVANTTLADTMVEYPDMVFHIRPNGSMVVWGIQGLGMNPPRVTKISVIMRTDQTVLPVDYPFFCDHVMTHCVRSHDNCHDFAEITIFGQRTSDGVMNAYSMNLDDFFSPNWTSPRLCMIHSWCGLRNPVKSIKRHPIMPFIAIQDEMFELSVFKASSSKIGLRSTSGLSIFGQLPNDESYDTYCWVPSKQLLLVTAVTSNVIIHSVSLNMEVCSTSFTSHNIETILVEPIMTDTSQSTFLLLGFGQGYVTTWQIHLIDETCELDLWSTVSFQPFDFVFSTFSFYFRELKDPVQHPSLFGTVSESNMLSLWHSTDPLQYPNEKKSFSWKEVVSFPLTEVDQVLLLKFASFGKVAIAHYTNNEYFVDIWDNEFTGLEMTRESRIKVPAQVIDVDWFTSFDGQHLLSVGFVDEAYVYTKGRTVNGTQWVSISDFKMEQGSTLKEIGWLPNGSILVSTSTSPHVYSPGEHQLNGKPQKLFETTSSTSGRLFDHDPMLLMQYLLWGQHELVKYNLSLLHRFVKIAVETNTRLQNLPLPLWKLVGNQYETSSKAGYADLFEFSDENTNTELGVFTKIHVDYLTENLAKSGIENSNGLLGFIKSFEMLEQHRRSLDDNGSRYYLGASYHLCLKEEYALTSRDFCWAYFSESQDYIIESLTRDIGGKILWKDARNLGLGWWIGNPNTLKSTFEIIARNQYWGYEGSNDPVACSLYYLGLKKKSVLLGLWKLAGNNSEQSQMIKFLSNNFDEERWQTAALKNAFALLGKQRYEYAAAFFLLANKLKDAANVCIKQLNDPQLAICLCRIYEGECGPVLVDIVKTQLLPEACENGDRWLSCILYSLINDRHSAYYCLTRPLESLLDPPRASKVTQALTDPSMLLLHSYLQVYYKKLILQKIPSISPSEELQFETECVRSYDRLGFPTLALQMLFDKKLHLLPEVQIIETTLDQNEVDALATANWSADKPAEKSLEVDWDAPAPKATGLDWGEIETKPAAGLDWGELETKPATGGLDWGELETKPAAGLDWGELETKAADLDLEDNTVEENPVAEVDDKPQEPGKLIVTEHEYMRMKIRHVNMKIYIRFLIMRILHDLHNSADLIVKYKNELKFDTTLSNYFDYLRKGFAELSETSQMHINDIGVLVKSRCEEMYALNAFVELLPFHDSISSFTRFAESMFINQTRMLCHVSFSSPSLAESTEKLHYVDTLSKDLLSSWKSWNEKCIKFNQLQSDRVVSQVIVTGFMIQLITATLLKRNNQLWWMLGLCEQLFDLLLKGDRKALSHLVSDVLSQKEPVPHPDDLAHGEAPPEFYDEFGIALFDRNSHEAATAEILLHSLVLSHVSSALKLYLERITELMNVNPELDKSHGFVSQSVQKNLTVYIFILDVQVARQWNKLEMDVKCIPAYIMECNLKDLWSLLCRTANAKQTVRGIIHTKNIKKWDSATFLADGYDDPSDDVISDLVVTSSSPILSFSINPLDRKQVAYVTTKGVNEIDSSISKTYFTSQPNAKEIGSQEDLTQLLKDSAIPDSRHSRSNSNGHLNFREKSNGSLGRLLKRQFTSFKKTDNSVNDKGLRLRRSVPLVTTIEAHRSLNCFLAGLGDSTTPEISVKLFQFGTEHELVSYSAASEGRLTKCRFDPYGAKFGGSDSRGDLHIWKFDPSPASLRPCIHLQQCHHGAINDFCFMNSSSILATAGISTNNMNVAVWDTLLPNSRSRVTQFQVGEAGMTSLLHSPKHNLLIAGGKKGMVYVMDMRHNLQVVNTFQAHDAVVKSITFNETNNTLISGSTSGEIKIWDINTLALSETPEGKVFRPFITSDHQPSVIELICSHGEIYSCWSNGTIYKSWPK